MIQVVRVHVGSCDIPCGVDGQCLGSLILASACAGYIEFGECAIGGAQEAVMYAVGVRHESRNIPCRVESDGDRSLLRVRGRSCARRVEGREAGRRATRGCGLLRTDAEEDQCQGKQQKRQFREDWTERFQ